MSGGELNRPRTPCGLKKRPCWRYCKSGWRDNLLEDRRIVRQRQDGGGITHDNNTDTRQPLNCSSDADIFSFVSFHPLDAPQVNAGEHHRQLTGPQFHAPEFEKLLSNANAKEVLSYDITPRCGIALFDFFVRFELQCH
jgi:hypothetical protein